MNIHYKHTAVSSVVLVLCLWTLSSCARIEKTMDRIWGEDIREEIDKTPYKAKRRPMSNPGDRGGQMLNMDEDGFGTMPPPSPGQFAPGPGGRGPGGAPPPMPSYPEGSIDMPSMPQVPSVPSASNYMPPPSAMGGINEDLEQLKREGGSNPFKVSQYHDQDQNAPKLVAVFEPMADEWQAPRNVTSGREVEITEPLDLSDEDQTPLDFSDEDHPMDIEVEKMVMPMIAPNHTVNVQPSSDVEHRLAMRKQNMFPLNEYAPQVDGSVYTFEQPSTGIADKASTSQPEQVATVTEISSEESAKMAEIKALSKSIDEHFKAQNITPQVIQSQASSASAAPASE